MLDIKVLRQEPERIKEALKKRFNPLDIEPAIELDKQRRAILAEVEQKKAKQNEITKAHVFSGDQGVYGIAGYTAEHDGCTVFHVIFSE